MADDHAAKAISAYGEGINKTPNIDRIANEGIRLNHCYVTNSICTPSRAAILTGTYNHVNCVTSCQELLENNELKEVFGDWKRMNEGTPDKYIRFMVMGKWK